MLPQRAPHAQVLIKRKKKGRTGETWEVVRARGHLDEVQELRKGGNQVVGKTQVGLTEQVWVFACLGSQLP